MGESLEVELSPLHGNPQLNVNCEARVVRVEESGMNGLTGIAVEFHHFDVEEPGKSQDDHLTRPFLRWTVDMVDEMFARRPELQTYASRIQGAA